MGKVTGFLEYERKDPGHRPVRERIKDYGEFTLPPGLDTLKTQAARCMDCGVPFCHAGVLADGQSIGCPLGNLIPESNDFIYKGEVENACKRYAETHPFPEFTGRVCPALCEGSCTLGERRDPVAIRAIERYLADASFKLFAPKPPAARTGKKIAVVGSGPSGLACADLLNKLGDSVTVFERADRPGGLLTYGIPNMKLDKKTVAARVSFMEKEGVRFVTNADVGGKAAVDLLKNFDAVVLCLGARNERLPNVPGKDLKGVHTALKYLTLATRALLDGGAAIPAEMNARGKDVVIVGGGDTGTDCVATAIRQGCKSVAQIEIMPAPPERRAENNPWPLWPRVKKTDYGQEEAIELFGSDPRRYLTTVKEIVGAGGAAVAVKTVEVEWKTENGRMVPAEKPGAEKTLPAGLVLTAMGFTGPETNLLKDMGIELNARGAIAVKEGSYSTNLHGVYAAGDARRGPSLVVWAILEGRKAALECHKALNG
ncbi:MAG: glutamate synthase subunit beta [Clostridiales bacterium]|jgi:glutamate synthase (NADPH/NADH) small chain|nr:glutamate synthase subunit beta [Clostridiales bacterium]